MPGKATSINFSEMAPSVFANSRLIAAISLGSAKVIVTDAAGVSASNGHRTRILTS